MTNSFPFVVPCVATFQDLPMLNETYIITLFENSEPTDTSGPSYQVFLNFGSSKTIPDPKMISLLVRTDVSILGTVCPFSKGGRNFIFIKFNRFDGILRNVFASADFNLKFKGICHITADKIRSLLEWCNTVSNMILSNSLIPNSDTHFISAELNKIENTPILRVEKNFSKDPLPYRFKILSSSDRTTINSTNYHQDEIQLNGPLMSQKNHESISDIEAGFRESERHKKSPSKDQEEKQLTPIISANEQENEQADPEIVQSSPTNKQQEMIAKLKNFQLEKHNREIIVRFRNSLNDSYLYAVLWCLLNAPLLVPYFLQKINETERNKKSRGLISCFFGKMVEKVACYNERSSREFCSDFEDLARIIRYCLCDFGFFERDAHIDANQFMDSFLEAVHKELNRVSEKPAYKQLASDFPEEEIPTKLEEYSNYMLSRDDSVVKDLFKGQMINISQCSTCSRKKYAFNDFGELSLKLNSRKKQASYSLDDLIADAMKEEIIRDGEGCSHCNQSDLKLKSWICKLPEILIITFQRQDPEKSEDYVKFPMNGLDLSQYLEKSVNLTKDSEYSVFGVVKSYGGSNMKCYTSAFRDLNNQKWYTFNGNEVWNSRIRNEKELEIPKLEILFYVKGSHIKDQ